VFDLVEAHPADLDPVSTGMKTSRRGHELEIILDGMSISQTVRIVRAFSYFSHLANIRRRSEPHPADAGTLTPPPDRRARDAGAGSVTCARGRLFRRPICAGYFAEAQVSRC